MDLDSLILESIIYDKGVIFMASGLGTWTQVARPV